MSILQNITRTDTLGSGGLLTLYVNYISSIASYSTSGSTVTGITLMTDSTPFISVQFEPETSEFTVADKSTLRDRAFDISGKFAIKGLNQSTRDALMSIGAQTVFIIAQTSNGTYWVLNDLDFGATIGVAMKSGAKVEDPNGYDLSIKAYTMRYLPYAVSPSILAGLLIQP